FEPLGLEMLTGVKLSDNIFVPDAIETALPNFQSKIYEPAFGSDDKFVCAGKLEECFLSNIPPKNKFEFIEFNNLKALQVDDLREVHYKSYRSIHRLYRGSLGVSPKEFLNLLRFRRSIRQIHSADQLTRIAYNEGFADQAHMSREFRKYTGVSPKVFGARSTLIGETLCWTLK
ncbi:MAG: helix-turn-helix transcriptional regulator, partial [Acidobacteria bacterium]|nr:helix-turn-helix transcriptional regulator [Acidobacteriota bacterium]